MIQCHTYPWIRKNLQASHGVVPYLNRVVSNRRAPGLYTCRNYGSRSRKYIGISLNMDSCVSIGLVLLTKEIR